MSELPLNLKERKKELKYNIEYLINSKKNENNILKMMIQILKHSEFVSKKNS